MNHMNDMYSLMKILHNSLGQQVKEKTLWAKDQSLSGLAVPGITFVHSDLTLDQKAYVLAFLYMSSLHSPLVEVFACTREDLIQGQVTEPCLRWEA